MKRVLLGAAAGISLGAALAVATTLRVPIFDFRSAASAPWLLTSVPGFVPAALAVVLGGVIGALLGRRGREDLLTPFLPCGLAAAIFLPGVFAFAPFLASFSGTFLGLLLAAALAVSISRLDGKLPGTVSPRTVFLAGFLSCLGVGSWISSRVGLSGDEPHYLLTTYSLLHDRDLAVQDNYGAEDFRSFYAGKIEPRLAPGTSYSVHGIGLPLLLAPGFAAFGLAGVLATEALLSALLLAALYRASLAITASDAASLAATAGFAWTSPGLFLTVSAYPELPAALLAALVALELSGSGAPSSLRVSGLAFALGALPFFHVKFLPFGAVLVGALGWRFGRAVWPSAISLGSFFLVSFLMFGSLDPTASYGRPRLFLEVVPGGIAGLLFDQEYGLLLHAPFYLLGFAGLVTLARRSPPLGVVSILALLAVLIPGAAHPLWSGGTSPPARFLFPALPFLALGAGALLAREPSIGVGRGGAWLLAWSLAFGLAMLFLPGGPFYLNTRDGTGRIWEALSASWSLPDYLPSLIEGDPRSLVSAGALFLLLGAVIVAQFARIRLPIGALFGALLLGALLHDRTGIERSRELEPHWVSRVMHRVSNKAQDRYAALPSFERLSREDLLARVSLPLEAVGEDGDPRHWWSRAYSLPAGRFRLIGTPPLGITFFNGEGAFQSDEPVFESAVALERFRLRARNLFEPPRLFFLEPLPESCVALATLSFAGLRIHALDENVYVDTEGFWTRGAARASFAIELESDEPRGARIQLANGGAPNEVRFRAEALDERLELAPWEEREIDLPAESRVETFTVESGSAFTPRTLDPSSKDDRSLGIRVRARLR